MNWDAFDKFEPIINKYMPMVGEGKTMASQIVTAVNKIIYKWYNDGDVYDNHYHMSGWCNNISSYANWLYQFANGCDDILKGISDCTSEYDYEELLYDLAKLTLNDAYLDDYAKSEKCGTIYECYEPFSFSEVIDDEDEDDEEDW